MRFRTAAAKQCGTRHAREGIPCQDAARYYQSADKRLAVAAVADGAGSRRYARESAQAAVDSLIDLFARHGSVELDRKTVLETLLAGQAALGLPREELGTTLLFVAVNGGNYIAGHIGDGVILRGNDDDYRVFSAPENGEFTYQTYFIPTSDPSHFRFYRGQISQGDCFLLSSDGLSDLLYDLETERGMPVCEKIERLLRKNHSRDCRRKLEDAMRNLFSQYSSDDMSIAVLSADAAGTVRRD